MPTRERINRSAAAQLHNAAVSADGGSKYVDAQEADGLAFIIAAGSVGATGSNTLTIKLQHADAIPGTAGSYADVPAEQQIGGPVVIDDDNQTHRLAYVGNKRYVRVVWTEAGTISGALCVIAVADPVTRADYPAGAILTTGAVS